MDNGIQDENARVAPRLGSKNLSIPPSSFGSANINKPSSSSSSASMSSNVMKPLDAAKKSVRPALGDISNYAKAQGADVSLLAKKKVDAAAVVKPSAVVSRPPSQQSKSLSLHACIPPSCVIFFHAATCVSQRLCV